jgi:hypothetical protein
VKDRFLMRLQGVQRALLPAGSAATSGHVILLKQKALTAILRRLDALLFGKLLAGPSACFIGLIWQHFPCAFLPAKSLPSSGALCLHGLCICSLMHMAILAIRPRSTSEFQIPALGLCAMLYTLNKTLKNPLVLSAGDTGEDARDSQSVFSGDLESLLSDGNINLDPELLPFPRGQFSFGVGVNLKMAVSRWTNWAADVGLREENMGAEEGCANPINPSPSI